MNKKAIIKIIVGIIILIVIIIGWLAWLGSEQQSKQTDTNNHPAHADISTAIPTDWPTFKKDTYRFELKYPKDWYVYERADGEKRIYIQSAPGEVNKETAPADFRRIWIAYASEEGDENPYNLTGSKKDIVVNNGIKMSYYEWLPDAINGEPTMEAYWTNDSGDKYRADCASEVGSNNSEQEVVMLKKILSTFKFTK